MKDPRDSKIYKLILEQMKELNKLSYSNKRVLNDFVCFNYSEDRKKEIIENQIEEIDNLHLKHNKEIMGFDLSHLWD